MWIMGPLKVSCDPRWSRRPLKQFASKTWTIADHKNVPYAILQKCRDIRIGKLGNIFNPQTPCRASETLGSKIGLTKCQWHFSRFLEGDISRLEISRIQDFLFQSLYNSQIKKNSYTTEHFFNNFMLFVQCGSIPTPKSYPYQDRRNMWVRGNWSSPDMEWKKKFWKKNQNQNQIFFLKFFFFEIFF